MEEDTTFPMTLFAIALGNTVREQLRPRGLPYEDELQYAKAAKQGAVMSAYAWPASSGNTKIAPFFCLTNVRF